MTFDELAQQPGAKVVAAAPSFDELAASPDARVVTDDGPSSLEAGARGVAQGATFGFADEIAGGAEALWDKLKGVDSPFADAYRKHRDESRANFKAAQDADSTAYGAGQIGGGVLSGLAAAPLTGGASLASAVALGAGGGALNALGEAKELDEDAAADVLKGGLAGGAFGAAGHGVGKLAAKGINALSSKVAPAASEMLEDVATSSANRAIRHGSTANALDLDKGQLLRALEEGIVDNGDDVASIAAKAGAKRAQAGGYGEELVNQLEPDVNLELGDVAKKWFLRADEIEANSIGSPVPQMLRDRANELMQKGTSSYKGGEWPFGDFVKETPLGKAIEIKRALQDNANYGRDVPKALEKVRREMAADLRFATESAVDDVGARADSLARLGQDTEANEALSTLAGNFKDANARTSDLIAISNAANKGAKLDANQSGVGLTAKMGGLAALATGNPLVAAGALAKHVYDKRGAATIAKVAFDLSKSLGRVGAAAVADPAKLGKFGSVLASAAQRGPEALNSTIFVLGMSDPEFQRMSADLDGGPEQPPDDGAIR